MRNIVAGLFEKAKFYFVAGISAKFLVAMCGILLSFMPQYVDEFGVTVLCLQILATLGLIRADHLKSAAEPMLTRLDYQASLGWQIPNAYIEDATADFAKYEQHGIGVRQNQPYFASEKPPGYDTLKQNIAESAFYTRTLALDARGVVSLILILLVVSFLAVLISGLYRHIVHGSAAAAEFVVDGLIFLVSIDLLPLAIKYNDLAKVANDTRQALQSPTSEEGLILPIVMEYQIARASAPLLPTFRFLSKRFPLAAIWYERH